MLFCTFCAVRLLHGLCRVKLLLFLHVLCTPLYHTTMYHVVSLPANPHTYNACVFSCILTLEWSTICGPYILWHWLASCSSDCLCASCHNYLVSNRLLWWLTPRQCQESFGLLAVASRNSCMTAGGSVCLKREAWKEEALDSLPWKDERGP